MVAFIIPLVLILLLIFVQLSLLFGLNFKEVSFLVEGVLIIELSVKIILVKIREHLSTLSSFYFLDSIVNSSSSFRVSFTVIKH